MNQLSFHVLGNYSPNIQMFGKKKATCYRLYGLERPVFLDFGAGIFTKFKSMIETEKIDLGKVIIIVSHNHVDHSLSLFPLAMYLRKYNKENDKNEKMTIYLPAKSIVYTSVKHFDDVFDVKVLNNNTKFEIGKYSFSFCLTKHSGESYATKIESAKNSFVYTSDLPEYSNSLEDFVEDVDTVLMDAGYPNKMTKSFKTYHGKTEDLITKTLNLGVNKVYASHIRYFSNKADYYSCFPKGENVELVKIGKTYSIFRE